MLGVEEALLAQEVEVAQEQPVDALPLVGEEDRLLDAEREVLLPAQVGGVAGRSGHNPLELLEHLVRVVEPARHPMASEPAGEVAELQLATVRDPQAREVLGQRQEAHVLLPVLVAERVVEVARVAHQVRRPGHVEHLAHLLLQLLQRQRRLAAPGRPDHDERRRGREHRFLCVVEREDLVQDAEGRDPRVDERDRLGVDDADDVQRRQLGLVDRPAAAQEPRAVVGVVGDVLEDERDHLPPVPMEREQQPVADVEACPVEVRPDLACVGCAEVTGFERPSGLLEVRDRRRIEAVVEQHPHAHRAYRGPTKRGSTA
jgi:hypothetical protein